MAQFGIERALRDEFNVIWARAVPAPPGEDEPDQDVTTKHLARVLAESEPQSALCLSGGGIRSAAFCLGVVQGLAKRGVLKDFHYLSTVSGGGYIGAWLQAWRYRLRNTPAGGIGDGTEALQEELTATPDAKPLVNLRNYTSFLIPDGGLTSLDSWAAGTLIGRNILINWLIVMPVLMAVTLLPMIYCAVLAYAANPGGDQAWLWGAVVSAPLLVSTLMLCLLLPSHFGELDQKDLASPRAISLGVIAPALVWAATLPVWVLAYGGNRHPADFKAWINSPILVESFVALMTAYCAAWLWASLRGYGAALFRLNIIGWTIACFIGCNALQLISMQTIDVPIWVVAVCGPLAAIACHLLVSLFYAMLRGNSFRGEQDREWLARLSAAKLQPVAGWAMVAAICLVVLEVDLRSVLPKVAEDYGKEITGAVTLISGIVAALFGKSDAPMVRNDAKGTGFLPITAVISVATAVFAIGLVGLLSLAAKGILLAAPDFLGSRFDPAGSALDRGMLAVGLAALLCAAAWGLQRTVNPNRFSMHGLYRNRLERAFLGSVRPITKRDYYSGELVSPDNQPPDLRGDADHAEKATRDPFTDFDGVDNLRMHNLVSARIPLGAQGARLFPVVNVALNLTASNAARAGWSERKAAPFTITPFACGSETLPGRGFAASDSFGATEKEQGEGTSGYGISLATAITISGAAASPNMGYYSTPATAFLMTLFNVRLGAWLPNPATVSACDLKRPVSTLRALFSELLGQSGKDGAAIYLSDGGHFENLGLYTMIRRGCRNIVVVDAAADPAMGFADLGNAVRKIQIDLGVEITFGQMPMVPRSETLPWAKDNSAWAVGTIRYPNPLGGTQRIEGKLLYIKACLPPKMPADVLAMARNDREFPHDTTANQFFTESMFESYRKLGRTIVETMPTGASNGLAAWLRALTTGQGT